MTKKIRIIISSILLIGWMLVIFLLSGMQSTESNKQSMKIATKVKEVVDNDNKKEETKKEYDKKVKNYNVIVRKCAHGTVYMALSIFVINLITEIKDDKKKRYYIYAIIICILYAISDEYHQGFIPGRSKELMDVIIDTIGSIIGIVMYIIIFRIKNIINKQVSNK